MLQIARLSPFIVGLTGIFSAITANALDWPQEIQADEVTIVVYQPQPEELDGNMLTARAAMSLEIDSRDEPIFGVFWFESRIDVDRDAGIATIRDLTVTKVRWPDSNDAQEQRFSAIVEARVPETGFDTSFERLSASLESAEIARKSLDQIKNAPPIIEFSQEVAVLLLFDGEPKFVDIDNSNYERAVNTPFAVARNQGSKTVYLSSGSAWYAAEDPLGPWQPISAPPPELGKMIRPPEDAPAAPATPYKVVVATEPTELIVTDGKPDWQTVPGAPLLYVQNTETPWLRDLDTNNMYVLLSGRWFRSKSEQGPWTFVRADELPASFAGIPPASDIGGVRTSVAGTPEADDAMLDAQIPQTAAIKRDQANLSVEYDGKPKFEKIVGTDVAYAVNTAAQVLQIDGIFYAVDNGVWFTSANPEGPWIVADDIPRDKIQEIPPSSPVYNTTYVNVYDSTPEVVYVGYTPGYLWSYPYYGVPIYGTGWYYPPYWGGFYYPRPPTWGFHVGYNPWTGWNYGLSWSNGFFSVGISWGGGYGCCGGGWYGGGYRGPTFINTGDINIGNNINVGNRDKIANTLEGRGASLNRDNARANIYAREGNRARNADPATAQRNLREARPNKDRANNIYADRDGNIARRNNDQWETRRDGQWQPDNARPEIRPDSRPQSRPETRPQSRPVEQPGSLDRRSLDRSYQQRQRGSSRQMSRPSNMRAPRGGGGSRRR
jgi:hypothetical protein